MDIFCLTVARKIKIQDSNSQVIKISISPVGIFRQSLLTHWAEVILQCFVSGRFALGLFVRQISLHSVLRVN